MFKRGDILQAARRDNRALLKASLWLVGICLLVFAVNGTYLRNWVSGPYTATAELLADPGSREWIRAEGPTLSTGIDQETTTKWLKGLINTKEVTAHYKVILFGGKFLVVKVPTSYVGGPIEGRLKALPNDLRNALPAAGGDRFYPYLLEDSGTGYRLDFNLFVLIAVPLFPFTLLLLTVALRQSRNVWTHRALKLLASSGPGQVIVNRIENELVAAGPKARIGPLWITDNWIVSVHDSLVIVPVAQLAGVGVETTVDKAGRASHKLRLWRKGRPTADSVPVDAADAVAIMLVVGARMPQAVVKDVKAFGNRWMLGEYKKERVA
jgi:hypothetical protein